ncbi:competence protein ComK [Piscibacillus salipiscarius]|uniref:Competence protein ComK n=1 Tax=Piscibacillus salipiscarius TaxID=299480 RepID=A0ABW5Q7J6_9BACI|nr:competence protein ComK [Piscibacillus salipiscarius]
MVTIEKVDHYFINNHTMVISPHYDPIYQSKIIEVNRTILSRQTPIQIIDSSCIARGGATLDGRKKAIEFVTKKKVMIPIPVEPSKGIILIPTMKVRHPDCTWIAYCHVKDSVPIAGKKDECNVLLSNNQTYNVDIPPSRMHNQVMLAAHVFGYFLKDRFIS